MRNFFQKNKDKEMETQTIIFTVETKATFGDAGQRTRQIRAIRAAIKNAIQADKNMKIIKIENKSL